MNRATVKPWTMTADLLRLVAAIAFPAALGAQSNYATVPAQYAAVDAPGVALWPFGAFEARHQLLLDRSTFTTGGSPTLLSLTVRRNAGDFGAVPAARIGLTVQLSIARGPAHQGGAAFADNRGSQIVTAFQGVVALPASPPVGTAVAPWSGAQAVTLPFAAPFQMRGSTLCIETETRPFVDPVTNLVDDAWWPVDAWTRGDSGALRRFGSSCVPGLDAQPATGVGATWMPGGLGVFALEGPRPGVIATCVIGTSDRLFGLIPLPLSLDPIGAPGCALHIDPAFGIATLLEPFPSGPRAGAQVAIPLPASASLTGARVYSQWFVDDPTVNALGLTMSNGVEATVGAIGADPGTRWIESDDLGSPNGRILYGRMPVIRIESR